MKYPTQEMNVISKGLGRIGKRFWFLAFAFLNLSYHPVNGSGGQVTGVGRRLDGPETIYDWLGLAARERITMAPKQVSPAPSR